MEMKIGIMGAMPEEVELVKELMTDVSTERYGMRDYYCGKILGIPVVLVFSRWGKVAAAATATTLIHRFGIDRLVFTGVAGAVHEDMEVGDVVIAKSLVQHDLDASPIIPRFEVPLLDISFIEADLIPSSAVQSLQDCIGRDIENMSFPSGLPGNKSGPRVFYGDIATGDSFISDSATRDEIRRLLPTVLCVEMEGGAVAQVCYENKLPFCVIRIISDSADHNSPVDFPVFVREVAGPFSKRVIEVLFELFMSIPGA